MNNTPPDAPEGGGGDNVPVEITLASWTDRFGAWLVDFIIISIGLGILLALIAPQFSFFYYGNDMTMASETFRPLPYVISSLTFFGYWTYFESTSGQSIGKKLLKIKTTDLSGSGVDIKKATIESFGKAFLLPLDIILGWVFTNNKRQRIFNKLSNTIVIKLRPREEWRPDNIRYTKD